MKRLIWLSVGLIVVFFLLKGWWSIQLAPVSDDKSTQTFVIAKGTSVSNIAKKLKDSSLIKSELAFKIYVKQNNFADQLQAGSYKLSPAMSVPELVKVLLTGSEDIRVTLIEGWRVEEIADRLNQDLKIDKKEFLKQAREGYMFPDTYLSPKEAVVEYIVEILKKTFESRFTAKIRTQIKSKGLTETQGVILASIVEREARSDKARTEVASILLKRLKMGMALNADATLQYILGYQPTEKSWWKRYISAEDKKTDSPYNTYLYAGLPPAPISNPSVSSLQAVADADSDTPYLYYYHDAKGNSYYAKTLEEHNRNVTNHP